MMGTDPLSQFLQNGSKKVESSIPVSYTIQPYQQVQNNVSGFFDKLNPMNWLKGMLQSNPQVQQVIDIIENNGGDAKQAFYNECKKRNADPDAVLQQVKNHPLFKQLMR